LFKFKICLTLNFASLKNLLKRKNQKKENIKEKPKENRNQETPEKTRQKPEKPSPTGSLYVNGPRPKLSPRAPSDVLVLPSWRQAPKITHFVASSRLCMALDLMRLFHTQ
jgi:hypothetical protein